MFQPFNRNFKDLNDISIPTYLDAKDEHENTNPINLDNIEEEEEEEEEEKKKKNCIQQARLLIKNEEINY